jgi:hypothetical protein
MHGMYNFKLNKEVINKSKQVAVSTFSWCVYGFYLVFFTVNTVHSNHNEPMAWKYCQTNLERIIQNLAYMEVRKWVLL